MPGAHWVAGALETDNPLDFTWLFVGRAVQVGGFLAVVLGLIIWNVAPHPDDPVYEEP